MICATSKASDQPAHTCSLIRAFASRVWKNSSVACGFSSIKIDYSDYPKSLNSKLNEVMFFSKNIAIVSRLFCCNHTCYCVNMDSVMTASRYHPRHQSRYSMHIRGLISHNFFGIGRAVPIGYMRCNCYIVWSHLLGLPIHETYLCSLMLGFLA